MIFNSGKKLKQSTTAVSSSTITEALTTTVNNSDVKYINITGDKMSGVLGIDPYIEFSDGSIQSTGYTNAKDDMIQSIYDKTLGFDFNNDTYQFNNPVNFTQNISIPTGNLSVSHINGLSGQLTNINNNISTNASNISTNANNISLINTKLNTDENDIQNLKEMDITFNAWKSDAINTLSSLSSNQTSILGRLDTDELNITNLQTATTNTNNIVSQNSSAITTLQNTKANITDVNTLSNKVVDILFLNGTTTILNNTVLDDAQINTLNVDSSLSINGSCIISNINYQITDEQFNYLSSIEEDLATTLNNIHQDISGNTLDILNNTQNITTNTNSINSINTSISNLNNSITDVSGNLNSLSGTVSTNSSNITNLQNTATTQYGYINSLQNRTATAENNIMTINTSLAGKQETINSNNRLNTNFIADGSISNEMFQTLYNIKTSESIQHQIDTITNNLSVLDGLQDLDIESISNINNSLNTANTSINTLNTFKTNQETYNSNNTTITNGLNTKINDVSGNVSNLNTQVNTLNNFKTSQETYNSNNTTITNGLNTNISDISGNVLTLNTQVNTLNNFKTNQESYNSNNTTITNGLNTKINDVSGNVLNLNNEVNTLNTFKTNQESYNSINDTNISNIQNSLGNLQLYDSSNKLNSEYVYYLDANNPTTTVQAVLQDYQNQIDNAWVGINSRQSLITAENRLPYVYVQSNYRGTETTLNNHLYNVSLELDTKQSIIDASNNKLPIANVNLGSSPLSYVDISSSLQNQLNSISSINTSQTNSITNINDAITALQNVDAGFNTRIQNNETNITSLQAHDIILDGQISTINTTLSGKQNTINNGNKLSSSLVSTNLNNVASTLDTVLSSFDTDLTNLDSGKQNLISSSNKLSIDLVDVSGSNIKYADYPSSIASKFSSLDGQISTLTTLQNGDVANFEAIDTNFQNIDSQLLLKQDVLSSTNKLDPAYINAGSGSLTSTKMQYLSSINGDIMTLINNAGGSGGSGGSSSYPSISYDSNNNTTTISNELVLGDNLMFSDNSVQTTAFTDSKNTDLSNVKSKLTNVSYSTNNTTITGTLIADNITSATLDTINNNITTNTNNISTLNTKVNDVSGNIITINNSLSTINSNITSLQNYDTNQTTLNTQVSNDITSLYNNKQNILSGTNKLNPTYIDAGTGTLTTTKLQNLSSITSDLQTQLNSKQATITDGSLTIAQTLGLQTALDGKQATITDGSLTIARTSGLQTALDGKQSLGTYGLQFKTFNKGTITGNLTISTSELCGYTRFATGATRTVILPAVTTLPDGVWFGMNGISTTSTGQTININDAVSGLIYTWGTASNTVAVGKNLMLVVIGGKWWVQAT